MHPRQHLDDIYRNIVPTPEEVAAVQRRIDEVVPLIGHVAEVRPAGSWAKGTMLRGRKEADLVLVLSEAPEAGTLEALAQRLAPLTGLSKKPDTSFKAVQLEFADGVSIDLLPVAKTGRTPEGPSVPRKLRHALTGIAHVEWLKRQAHGDVLHPVIRLMKHFRDTHPREFAGVSSFAIEALCVELRPAGDLYEAFSGVLRALAGGWLDTDGHARRLADPADSANDLLAEVDSGRRGEIASAATAALRAIDASSWSQVFPGDRGTLPPPAANLGGRTLG